MGDTHLVAVNDGSFCLPLVLLCLFVFEISIAAPVPTRMVAVTLKASLSALGRALSSAMPAVPSA